MPTRQTVPAAGPGDIGRTGAGGADRKRRGDYATPPALVELVIDHVLPPIAAGSNVSVLDPACGDGRFLVAAARRILAAGATPVLHGVELDPDNAAAARRALADLPAVAGTCRVDVADALGREWGDRCYDVVVGNPPYLSQLATDTARGGSSPRGGGPYADVAAEFLHLAVQLARPGGGRVGLVLPQSILASRDVGAIRDAVDRDAERIWSWWSPSKHFDADVLVCALGFERRATAADDPRPGNPTGPAGDRNPVWTDVVVATLGVPELATLAVDGVIGDRARFTADFRDCYYGLVPAVGDHVGGPRLITSGMIDPLRSTWGERPVRFGRRPFAAPRVALDALSPRLRTWAVRMAAPKVLVANQARIIECVVDADGTTLPGVPVVTARAPWPDAGPDWAWEVAAVLTSPVASAWVWRHAAGTGMSARVVRLGPRLLSAVPWPAGPLGEAVEAARAGDVRSCGRSVDAAFGIAGRREADLFAWWSSPFPVVR